MAEYHRQRYVRGEEGNGIRTMRAPASRPVRWTSASSPRQGLFGAGSSALSLSACGAVDGAARRRFLPGDSTSGVREAVRVGAGAVLKLALIGLCCGCCFRSRRTLGEGALGSSAPRTRRLTGDASISKILETGNISCDEALDANTDAGARIGKSKSS